MSQEMRKKNFNVQKPPKTYLRPICSGFRTFWHLKKWFWVLPQHNFGARGQESCQNGQFCKFLIFSRKSNSTTTNVRSSVCPSVCQLPKPPSSLKSFILPDHSIHHHSHHHPQHHNTTSQLKLQRMIAVHLLNWQNH